MPLSVMLSNLLLRFLPWFVILSNYFKCMLTTIVQMSTPDCAVIAYWFHILESAPRSRNVFLCGWLQI